MIAAFLHQYGFWTANHAIRDPWGPRGRAGEYGFFVVVLAPLLAFAFRTHVPRSWKWTFGIFALATIIVPERHTILGGLPFLCAMAADGIERAYGRKTYTPDVVWAVLMLVFVSRALVFVHRPRGIMDTYYIASKVQENGPVKMPVWTNAPMLYVAMDWPIPGNDFQAHLLSGGNPHDWSAAPYADVKTRIYLTTGKPAAGDIPLDRGIYTRMRIEK